jgi:hypothetical protein
MKRVLIVKGKFMGMSGYARYNKFGEIEFLPDDRDEIVIVKYDEVLQI